MRLRFNAKVIASIFESQWDDIWKDKFSIKPKFTHLVDKTNSTEKVQIVTGAKKSDEKTAITDETIEYKDVDVDVFPHKFLGITCHVKDKIMLEKILDEYDFKAIQEVNFVIGWFKPKRFKSYALVKFFDDAWEKLIKDEFYFKPVFLFEGTTIQLGYYCHKNDEKETNWIP